MAACFGTETAFHVFQSDLLDPDLRKKLSFPMLEISVLFSIEKRKSNRWFIVVIFRLVFNLLGRFLGPCHCYFFFFFFGGGGGFSGLVRALVSGSSGPGSSPDRGHCVLFLGKTIYSHSASLRPGVQMGTGDIIAGGNPAMD